MVWHQDIYCKVCGIIRNVCGAVQLINAVPYIADTETVQIVGIFFGTAEGTVFLYDVAVVIIAAGNFQIVIYLAKCQFYFAVWDLGGSGNGVV